MILELTAAATAGGFVGYFTCAAMTMSKVADAQSDDGLYVDWQGACIENIEIAAELKTAHARATDALATKQARIDRALECETPGANATVKRMARILRGEQGA